jgi:predicted CxxxxCH...CXXCH cytochrome family protein
MNARAAVSIILVLVPGLLFYQGCTKLKENLPTPASGSLSIHSPGWGDTTSPNFHGKVLKTAQYATDNCVACHAKSFRGGVSGVGCFTCHRAYPHTVGWSTQSAANFHGKFLLSMQGQLSDCVPCHGSAYTGGTSGVSCYTSTCHASYPHTAGWENPASALSHGKYLKATDWNVDECAPCHGRSFMGGTSGVSCFECHPPFPHEVAFDSTGRHPKYMRDYDFPLDQCRACHGSSYTGGAVVDVSCMSAGCHTDASGNPKTPEACNTCHGQFRAPASDFLSAAPPASVRGDTATTVRGVGAHQKHLVTGTLGKKLKCQECHTVPSSYTSPGHIDEQAEVVFNDTLARTPSGDGTLQPAPVYNTASGSCANVYCHGNWKLRKATSPYAALAYSDTVIVANNYSPLWTGGSAESACGTTCHALPPTGHVQVPIGACTGCHTGVIDGNGNIIDPTKHINGKINVFNLEMPFR